ncbi:N-acetylmuramoyl-L-alanine amidase [Bifidobacterium reuteri]|uniref:N-acetylmuramoyl-L-alanine amidase n=2 Tax=Bifidobacterium reuteri TaxID=983706 RepID=A0A087CSE7_9BIFI|nr:MULTISPECIES: peptidoglycan recognition family protein [Bifidobacterium]KAA8824873.1 N-acetylmuramoyl-L-alanine amidase [Bifidobacterium reuteri]KFI86197.1 N-acetylmuramoyl-L-alanine amidase [Bifidobacterium reuteri DSM 23975]TPF78339.1 hypothetical protein BW09_04610 [Bifidobacterium sp. UTCIF-1]TPF81240.1 hypothetical protein BW08_00970 [Bifidobacterium sp. UTCIF-24]TPF82021.1 hypothetical protein BW12_07135 [Bifidobacterium sp. UTCIF-3]
MKDWKTLTADEDLILNTHYTPGRAGRRIDKIVLHHNAANLTIRGCYDVWQSREASAHYQVQADGRIGQLVWDTDTAWHAGDYEANCTSIGIEHADISDNPWRISDATLDNGAHLVAALCHAYGLGAPTWMVNVFPHSYFSPTECPASIAGSQNSAYMSRARQWYVAMANNTTLDSSTADTNEGDNDMAAAMIRNDDTGLIYYWTPETGLTPLGEPAEADVLSQAGVKTIHANNKAPWWVRAQQVTNRVQARTLAYEKAQTAALETLARNVGAPADQIVAAVKASVDKALADVSITLANTKEVK